MGNGTPNRQTCYGRICLTAAYPSTIDVDGFLFVYIEKRKTFADIYKDVIQLDHGMDKNGRGESNQ